MHAYIVSGGTVETRAEYIVNVGAVKTELIHLQAEKTTLTIKQIHELIATLSVTASSPRLVWIEEAQQLTVPAQNTLLKMLEEPPRTTTFYLTCQAKSSLLPTIRSRCTLINLPNSANLPNSSNILTDLKTVMSQSPGDRLALIMKRDRSESIAWITQIELALRSKLSGAGLTPGGYATLAKIARLALDAHTQFAANCSVSLVTQNFLLALPKSK